MLRTLQRFPILVIACLWPLVILAPHLPGIPRPSIPGLPWRQEIALSLLLTAGLGLTIAYRKNKEVLQVHFWTVLLVAALALFSSWIWLSAIWAINPYPAIHLALQWSMCLVFFVTLVFTSKNPRATRLTFIVLAGVVWILGIACAIETWFGMPLTDGNLRNDLKPILRGSGTFGEMMAMAAILFTALALFVKRPRRALACGITAMLAWMATLQSLERAPLVGAIAGFCLLIIGTLVVAPARPRSWTRLALLVVAIALVLGLQTIPSLTLQTAGSTSAVARLNQNPTTDINTRVRFLFWGVALEMFRAHPVIGVGGNNYEVNFVAAREKFSADHSGSSLVGMNEDLLTVYAHNEYLQMLAELGAVGLVIFIVLSSLFVLNLWRALRHSRHALPALGAGSAMLAFTVSSGASGSSFRNLGSSLLFFFAGSIIARISADRKSSSGKIPNKIIFLKGSLCRWSTVCACVLLLVIVGLLSSQAGGTILHGLAQTNSEPEVVERYYRESLSLYPSSAATHFSYGMWLSNIGRTSEAVPHLSFAVKRGFNSSVCFAYLAGAEANAGNEPAAERTLATAAKAYPASVFLLVRHSVALARTGRMHEAEAELAKGTAIDSRAARGWQQLIENDIDTAYSAAKQDSGIALPGELNPQSGVFAILKENEQRFPEAIHTGWRARMQTRMN